MILVAAAALAVLVGVVYVVLGKGGQLARFEADYPPLPLPDDRAVRARDLGRVMLPLALWGYHVRAVDELLLRLTTTLREREERIEDLEWRLSRLDPSYVPEGTGPLPGAHLPGDAYAPGAVPGEAYAPGAVRGAGPEGPDAHGGPDGDGDAERVPAGPGDAARGEAADDVSEDASDDAAVGGNQR
jgi:cbb3-type cytochrome oxidase subunit 3